MNSVVIAKFGGSVIGIDGASIPLIIERIKSLTGKSKLIAVFSAPLTTVDGNRRSLTDVALELGKIAEGGSVPDLTIVRKTYEKIVELVDSKFQNECKMMIDDYLEKVKIELEKVAKNKEFADETRSKTLAFSGEIIMSQMMEYVLKSHNIKSQFVGLEDWPIITDNNIESTNFLVNESSKNIEHVEKMLEKNDVISIGGFIGRTKDGIMTTYERGGSDRTAADLGILLHKKFDVDINNRGVSVFVSDKI